MQRIFLIGFMGSGKTSFGRKLAKKLELPFFDLDKEIEKRTTYLISEIFLHHGEELFRLLEKKVLQDLVNENDQFLIATGGGTPCFFNNMNYMNKKGKTVYLKYSPEMLHSRLKRAKQKRPLLKGMNDARLKEYISHLLKEREAYYMKADLVTDSKNLKAEDIKKRLTDAQ